MTYFGDPSTKLCVSVCPNISVAFSNVTANIYQTVGISYSDYSTRLCVRTCPATYGLHGTFGDNVTNNCVQNCPTGTFGDAQTVNRVCVTQCSQSSSQSFSDPTTNLCVPVCPTPLFG
jgi:hypothetical protein